MCRITSKQHPTPVQRCTLLLLVLVLGAGLRSAGCGTTEGVGDERVHRPWLDGHDFNFHTRAPDCGLYQRSALAFREMLRLLQWRPVGELCDELALASQIMSHEHQHHFLIEHKVEHTRAATAILCTVEITCPGSTVTEEFAERGRSEVYVNEVLDPMAPAQLH